MRAALHLTITAIIMAVTIVHVAHTRVDCSGGPLASQVRSSTAIFIGRLDGPADVPEPLPPMLRGAPDAFVTLVVTRVLKGTLQVGERVRVRWRGWFEAAEGEIAGGCRVPGTDSTETYPYDMLVFAQDDEGTLTVPNRSRSTRLAAAHRDLVERVARMVARTERRRE